MKSRFRPWMLVNIGIFVVLAGLTWPRVHQAQVNRALLTAIGHNDAQGVVDALNHGANANVRFPIQGNSSWWGIFWERLQNKGRENTMGTPAIRAAVQISTDQPDPVPHVGGLKKFADNPRIIQALLDHGAQTETPRGMKSLLSEAAFNGETNTVRVLLEHGANPNVPEAAGVEDGFTPLLWAAMRSRQETIHCLLEHGADVNLRSKDGTMAITYAVEENDVPTIEAELDKGANINVANKLGNTPLMQAVQEANVETVNLLLQRHADVQPRNHDGQTALLLAQTQIDYLTHKLAANSGDSYSQKMRDGLNKLNKITRLLNQAGAKP